MAESDDAINSNITAAAAAAADVTLVEPTWSPTSAPELFAEIEKVNMPMKIATKSMSFLSAMGSAYIIYSMVIRHRHNTKLKRSFDRLLLGLCAADFVSSLSTFIGSW